MVALYLIRGPVFFVFHFPLRPFFCSWSVLFSFGLPLVNVIEKRHTPFHSSLFLWLQWPMVESNCWGSLPFSLCLPSPFTSSHVIAEENATSSLVLFPSPFFFWHPLSNLRLEKALRSVLPHFHLFLSLFCLFLLYPLIIHKSLMLWRIT